jgi:hypothetical protein
MRVAFLVSFLASFQTNSPLGSISCLIILYNELGFLDIENEENKPHTQDLLVLLFHFYSFAKIKQKSLL